MGNDMRIYFAKDYLALITYISILVAISHRRADLFRPRFLFFFSLFFWIAVLQVFNPEIPSMWYGLLGLKLYFYYCPDDVRRIRPDRKRNRPGAVPEHQYDVGDRDRGFGHSAIDHWCEIFESSHSRTGS